MIEVSRLFRISGNKVLLKTAALLVGTAMMSAPGVIFADSIFPIQAGHEMATASLGRLLAERGWKVDREDDGSILLHPQQGNTEQGSTEVLTVAEAVDDTRQKAVDPIIDTTYWQANLEPHGWSVEADSDGSVVLIPGAVEVQTVAAVPSISPRQDIPGQMDLAWLRDRLTPHGWGVERDPDGSVLLTPEAVDVQTVVLAPFAVDTEST